MNDNQTLPIEDAQRLSCELSEVLAGADIIGLRAFGPNPSDVHIRKISQAIDKKNLRGALGMIEALQYGDRAVKNGEFHNTVLRQARGFILACWSISTLFSTTRRAAS